MHQVTTAFTQVFRMFFFLPQQNNMIRLQHRFTAFFPDAGLAITPDRILHPELLSNRITEHFEMIHSKKAVNTHLKLVCSITSELSVCFQLLCDIALISELAMKTCFELPSCQALKQKFGI
jgi:hypothetical protein